MKIENLETADCQLETSKFEENKITFFFERVYDVKAEDYVDGVSLIIKEWDFFVVKIYISESPFSKPTEKVLVNQEIQEFDLIQELIVLNDQLTMGGYSKESRHWMVYEFTNYKYEIIKRDPLCAQES